MFTLKTAKVIGTPNGMAWSQVHEFQVEGKKFEKRGRLLVVLTLKKAGEGIEVVSAGREVLARINEEYYGNLEGTPFERLQETLVKIAKEFKNLGLVAGVFYQKVGYFGVFGGGRIVVKRGPMVQTILDFIPDGQRGNPSTRAELGAGHSTETQNETEALKVRVGSGFIQAGDIFLLGSKKFFDKVAEGTWRAALGAGELEEMVEILAPIVAGREEIGGVAVGIVKVGSEITEKAEQEPLTPSVSLRVKPDIPSGVPQKVKRVISRLPRKLLRSHPVFVRSRMRQEERKKTLLTVAVILIFLLLISVVLGIRKRAEEKRSSQIEGLIAQIESRLEEGKGLGTIKPTEAKEVLQEAKKLLDESSRFRVQSASWRTRLKDLSEEIEVELAKVVREYQFSELSVFWDLSLVSQDAKGDDLSLYKDKLVVLDKENKRVIEIDISSKAHQILAGGEDLSGATQLALYEDKAYTLTEKGIWKTKAGKTNLIIEKDEKWGEITNLAVYKGNLYLLDKKEKTVWRYLVTETGFGTKQNWLKGEEKLSQPVSLTINGFVWILDKENGLTRILKFASGTQESFAITGLEKPLTDTRRIYTDGETKNLYLLDKGNYRVVVLDKEGNYQASYLWVGIADVQDMVVSEENKIILLLAKNKIYQIEIR